MTRLNPLGYPVEFVSSSAPVAEIAQALWGDWAHRFGDTPLSITIEVNDGPAAEAAPSYRAGDHGIQLLCDPSNAGTFSAECKSGRLMVSRATLERREWFEYNLLEPLVLTALDMVYFDPVHAACVARGERGILLCGDSGAGKTTLAYACGKTGWTLISEDGIHLAADAAKTLVGGFWKFRLRDSTRVLFPELEDVPLAEAPNGKMAIIVDASTLRMKTAREIPAGKTVFLKRRPGPAELTSIAPDAPLAYMLQTAKRLDRAASEQRLREMLDGGCHLLSYERLEDAVRILETLA